MVSIRIALVLVLLPSFRNRVDAFLAPTSNQRLSNRAAGAAQCNGPRRQQCHKQQPLQQQPHFMTAPDGTDTNIGTEWQVRNVYDDLDQLRQRMAQASAQDRLLEVERKDLLDCFAANRRPLFPDMRKFALYPLVVALSLSVTLSYTNNTMYRLYRMARCLSITEFWLVVVLAPIRQQLAVLLFPFSGRNKNASSVTTAASLLSNNATSNLQDVGKTDQSASTRRARDLYATVVRLEEPPEVNIRICVRNLLEQWVSAVAGTLIIGSWLAYTAKSNAFYTRAWPFIRLLTRLGAVASLHQYPKLLYDIRRQPRPWNKSEHQLHQQFNIMLQLSVVGITMDLTEIMFHGFSRSVVLVLFLTVLAFVDMDRMLPGTSRMRQNKYIPWGILVGSVKKSIAWLPYFYLGGLLWSLPKFRFHQLACGIVPVACATFAPLLHLVGLVRLVRINYTHDLSLANSSSRMILQNDAALAQRMKWRYRLEWRPPSPTGRFIRALLNVVDDGMYRTFFAGGVPDKLMEVTRKALLRETKDLEKQVIELDEKYPGLRKSSNWKQEAMENLAHEHQTDYEDGSFRDPLGVAIQQTLGVGLGFADGHMDPLPEGQEPSARRLQSRAAKSAIRRVQEIYDEALSVDLDSIQDLEERETVKAELRRREKAETQYLANQLTELVPLDDEGDIDDPAARVNLPKTSILKMLRSLLPGVSQYDESVGPDSSWK